MNNSQNNYIVPLLIALIAVVVVCSNTYSYSKNNKNTSTIVNNTDSEFSTNTEKLIDNTPTSRGNTEKGGRPTLKELEEKYHFTFSYPSDYVEDKSTGEYENFPSTVELYDSTATSSRKEFYPPSISVKILITSEIHQKDLGGGVVVYDKERKQCKYIYDINNLSYGSEYQENKINGYNYCSLGDMESEKIFNVTAENQEKKLNPNTIGELLSIGKDLQTQPDIV